MDDTQRRGQDVTEIARQAEAIWTEVLEAPPAERGATFFELGGQSISAVRIVARIEDELGVRVDMGDLFEDPDVEAFVKDVLAKAKAQQGTELAGHNID